MRSVIIAGVLVHTTLVVYALFDLFNRSRRPNKSGWSVALVILPIVGVAAYELTKKRKRKHMRWL
ncbi:MAG: PLDc_N domain-containing protein [Cytophagales bacterium]|nr:PLDc_N domain-containing protein [Cytophagales bacterium]